MIQPAVRKCPNATASRQIFHDRLRPLPSLRISLHTTHTSVYSTHISREPQPTHQSAVYASVYSLWISLQPTHPSTVYALIYSLRIRLQHTHPSAAKSIYSIHISIKHTHQSAVYASICSMRMNLQHTHQSTAQRSVYSHTLACSLHTSLQHAHQPTATGGYACF